MKDREEFYRDAKKRIEESWSNADRANLPETYRQAFIDQDRYVAILKAEKMLESATSVELQAKYFSNIIAVGYAGYFATWFLLNSIISESQRAWIAALGFASLCAFIVWEIFQMMSGMFRIKFFDDSINNILEITDAKARLDAIYNYDVWHHRLLYRAWVITFILSVAPAIIGAGIMLYSICDKLKFD